MVCKNHHRRLGINGALVLAHGWARECAIKTNGKCHHCLLGLLCPHNSGELCHTLKIWFGPRKDSVHHCKQLLGSKPVPMGNVLFCVVSAPVVVVVGGFICGALSFLPYLPTRQARALICGC